MKRASNSLLTLNPMLFTTALGRRTSVLRNALPSVMPRSPIRQRLGEGGVRSLLLTLVMMSSVPALRGQDPARPLEAAEVAPVLKAALLKSSPWKESELEVRSVEGLRGLGVRSGPVALRVLSLTPGKGRSSVMALLEVTEEGAPAREFWVTAGIRVRAQVLAAARAVPQGKAIGPEDVTERTVDISDLRTAYLRSPAEAAGMVARRSIPSGDPLTRDLLSEPILVRNGETVRLCLVRGGISLTSTVRAEQDGRMGQWIKVRNLDFASVLKAEVTGRAEVQLR